MVKTDTETHVTQKVKVKTQSDCKAQKQENLDKCMLWCPLAPEKRVLNPCCERVGGNFALRKRVPLAV